MLTAATAEFQAEIDQSILAVAPQSARIKELASQFYGTSVVRETNKSLVIRCDTRDQALSLGAVLNQEGWSLQVHKGLLSTQFYALVYFNYPY